MRYAALALALPLLLAVTPARQPAFPAPLETYFKASVKLTPEERTTLQSGTPVTRLLDSDPTKEVAVFGAVWIGVPPERYVRAASDIERFEQGEGFLVTKKISDPPRAEDFAGLKVSDDDFAALRDCQVKDCAVKLGQEALDRIKREVHWSAPSARAELDAAMRRIALEYVEAYRKGGNAELAVYRDKSDPTFVAKEFESMVSRVPELTSHLPDVRRSLLEYPRYELPGSRSFLYWQNVVFGLKPTLRINHVVIADYPQGTVVTSKMLYASHYFWTALELRVLVPDPARGPGFWFVNVNRSRSDGLSGFVGMMLRGTVRRETQEGLQKALVQMKQRLESEGKRP
ncbi:MAG: hypothetical protein ACHQO8_05680 [Vicinamibacterales bacterium]